MALTKRVLGWREWVSLPQLGIDKLKCKVDTGARTSALHAFYIEPFMEGDKKRVRFGVHPKQHDTNEQIECVADVLDERDVTDSGGHVEKRYVIETEIQIGLWKEKIEMTLTNRDTMRFRMLLGRTAVRKHFYVDAGRSYQAGKKISYTISTPSLKETQI